MEESRYGVAGPVQCLQIGKGGVCRGSGICMRPDGGADTWGRSNNRCKVDHSPALLEELKEVLLASVELMRGKANKSEVWG